MLYDVLQEKRDLILKVADDHGIQNVRVFGSVARHEDGPTSDLDLLVEFEKDRSLFDLIRFKLQKSFDTRLVSSPTISKLQMTAS